MLKVNTYPKLILTETCNIYKLYWKQSMKLFKINEKTQNLYFKLAAILNKVGLYLMFSYIYHKWNWGS